MLCFAPNHIQPIINKGGLEYSGRLGESFVSLRATIDIKQAVEDAQIILIIAPSPIHETYVRMLASLLTKKRIQILCLAVVVQVAHFMHTRF
jgi:hypothetical protein